MVNRVLTSPYLWWLIRFRPVSPWDRLPNCAGALKYGHDRFIPRAAGRRRPRKRALAIRPADRAIGPLPAWQALDNIISRRAAAPGAGLRRPGTGKTCRRFWPLPHRQGHRTVPEGGGELAF